MLKTEKKRVRSSVSMSYLITRNLSQSESIKLGIALELVLKDIIVLMTSLNDIRPKNENGKKERDHLFIDIDNKIIYYAELKSNLNLDTEKCKSTQNKVISITEELRDLYPDYKIISSLVGLRYFYHDDIPNVILRKYNKITNNVCGIRDYLDRIKINVILQTPESYIQFLNFLVTQLFDVDVDGL